MAEVGRPTVYKPEFAEQARKLCHLGATNSELADFFGVSTWTIGNWSVQHEEFSKALAVGLEAANARVGKALYSRALGYSYDAVKIVSTKDGIEKVPYREHVPPDIGALKYWLYNKDRDPKNRKEPRWLSSERVEHSGPNGAPIQSETASLDGLSVEELRALKAIAAKVHGDDDS